MKLSTTPKCPACDATLDGATNATGTGGPDPGDFSICAYCFVALRFIEGPDVVLCLESEAPDEVRKVRKMLMARAARGPVR